MPLIRAISRWPDRGGRQNDSIRNRTDRGRVGFSDGYSSTTVEMHIMLTFIPEPLKLGILAALVLAASACASSNPSPSDSSTGVKPAPAVTPQGAASTTHDRGN
jgi:hypothetical protein